MASPYFAVPSNDCISEIGIEIPRIAKNRIRRKGGDSCPFGINLKPEVWKTDGKCNAIKRDDADAEPLPDASPVNGLDMNDRQAALGKSAGEDKIALAPETRRLNRIIKRSKRRLAG